MKGDSVLGGQQRFPPNKWSNSCGIPRADGRDVKEVDRSQSITSDAPTKRTERPWNKQLFLAGSRPPSLRDAKMAPANRLTPTRRDVPQRRRACKSRRPAGRKCENLCRLSVTTGCTYSAYYISLFGHRCRDPEVDHHGILERLLKNLLKKKKEMSSQAEGHR